MKFKKTLLLSASLALLGVVLVPTSDASGQAGSGAASGNLDSQQSVIANFAQPFGFEQGRQITIYVPPTAHMTEIMVWFDESVDAINGLQIYYQPDLDSRPVSSNFVGKREGRLIRVSVGWNDVINGLEVETSPANALASFILTTEQGAQRGFRSTLANGEAKRFFGSDLKFAGLTVRADDQRVYGMGLNLVPASSMPTGIARAPAGGSAAQSTPAPAPTPVPQPTSSGSGTAGKTGFAKAVDDFKRGLEQGKAKRAAEAQSAASRPTPAPAPPPTPAPAPPRIATVTKPTPAPTPKPQASVPSGPRLGATYKVILYEECDYGGKAVGLGPGTWSSSALKRAGMPYQATSSVKVLPGYLAEAYAVDVGMKGQKWTFDEDIPCLTYRQFDNALRSVRVLQRPALKFGEPVPAGYKPRGPEELKWSPLGVTGNNVVAVYYDRHDGKGTVFQSGRFEITAEGSDIWNWFVTSTGSSGRQIDSSKPISQLRAIRRDANTVTLRDTKTAIHSFTIDIRKKTLIGHQAATNGQPAFDFFKADIKTQSRPE